MVVIVKWLLKVLLHSEVMVEVVVMIVKGEEEEEEEEEEQDEEEEFDMEELLEMSEGGGATEPDVSGGFRVISFS